MAKEEETHVSIPKALHTKLKAIADKEHRSMRAVLTRLIEAEHLKGTK